MSEDTPGQADPRVRVAGEGVHGTCLNRLARALNRLLRVLVINRLARVLVINTHLRHCPSDQQTRCLEAVCVSGVSLLL